MCTCTFTFLHALAPSSHSHSSTTTCTTVEPLPNNRHHFVSKQPLGPPNPIRRQKRTTKFRLWCGGRKTSRTTFQFRRCDLPDKFIRWPISDQHRVRTAPTTFAALHIGAVQRVAALIHVRFRGRWVWKIPQQRFRQCVVHVSGVVGCGDPIPIQRGLQMWPVLHQQF